MNNIFYVSASQIETYKDCPRKWGFRSLDKIKTPTSPGAQYGSDLHKALEKYLLEGTIPKEEDFKKLIEKAKLYLPEKDTPKIVEGNFELIISSPREHPIKLRGIIDCAVIEKPYKIIDHKYLSDLRYMKSPEELENNIQSIMYNYLAYYGIGIEEGKYLYKIIEEDNFEGPILNRWIYYNAKGKTRPKKVGKVIPIEIEVTREQAESKFQEIKEKYIMPMSKSFREVGCAKGLDPNYLSCKLYGGCPYIALCKPDAKQTFLAIMSQKGEKKMKQSDLIKNLKKKREKAQKEKSKPEKKDLKKIQEDKGAKGVNPEESKEDLGTIVEDDLNKIPTKSTDSETLSNLSKIISDKPITDSTKTMTWNDENKTDLGRPPTSYEFAKKAGEILKDAETTTITKEWETGRTSISNSDVKIDPIKSKGLTVLFGSVVAKGTMVNTVHLIELLTPLLNEIVKSKEVEHWALLPLYELKPLLAGALDEFLAKESFEGTIIVQDKTIESDAVREVLIKHADVIIQGV
jgi:hypothetical protein